MPWWGASVFALGGSAFGVLITGLITLLGNRTTRRRLSREDRLSLYPRLAGASRTLANTRVWPIDTEAEDREWTSVLELAEQVAFLGSAQVNAAVETLVAAARSHRVVIAEIRQDSNPGHREGLDRRFRSKHSTSVATLRRAIDEFVRTGRGELEIKGAYRPIEGAGDHAGEGE